MFSSVLVANRGEIARRVFRTASRVGLRTVAVCSEADVEAPHAREADEAVLIGPAAARESYLRADAVLDAARRTGAEAIHPGYGFLSENADFAEAVTAAGLIWIGPPPAAIRAMGLKDAAKTLMTAAGVPVTPGYLGDDQSVETLAKAAGEVGYPVLIKAVAGGGGKGMKRVDDPGQFADSLASAKREAAAAFGDDRVLIEKYVARPRHVEVQVFGDTHGNVVHLYERDCSLQRRHQKVIEEAPAPGIDAATRQAITSAAIRAARAVDYVGAGTVEFIADASEGLHPDRCWFMEMNTRLQVEHPVTEMVTGLDLVEWQLRVAAGEPLPLSQDQIRLNGHAIEARLYAEDPAKGFLPSVGRLSHFRLPSEGVRVDSAVEEGGEVSQFYDPMIAKIVAFEDTREEAAAALADACRAVEVWPVRTNAAFLARCLDHEDFVAGEVDTGFIPQRLEALTAQHGPSRLLLSAAAHIAAQDTIELGGDAKSPWSGLGLTGFRLNAPPAKAVRLWLDGGPVEAEPAAGSLARRTTMREPGLIVGFEKGQTYEFFVAKPLGAETGDVASDGTLRAPMPGKIVAVQVAAGTAVEKGRAVVVLEAMKMEHALVAPFDGTVTELPVSVGDQVVEGALLARIEKA